MQEISHLAPALLKAGLISKKRWEYINSIVFARTAQYKAATTLEATSLSAAKIETSAMPYTPQDDAENSTPSTPKNKRNTKEPQTPQNNAKICTPSAPENKHHIEEWYSRDLPIGPFLNYLLFIKHAYTGYSVPLYSRQKLGGLLHSFRDILSSICDISVPAWKKKPDPINISNYYYNRNNNKSNKITSIDLLSPLAHKGCSILSHVKLTKNKIKNKNENEDKDENENNKDNLQYQASKNETLNVNFLCRVVNAIINRSHNYNPALREDVLFYALDPSSLYKTGNTYISHRKPFTVGNPAIYTSCVNAYTHILINIKDKLKPKKEAKTTAFKSGINLANISFIIKVKRFASCTPKLQYQVAAELAGWIYSQRAEFKAIFAQQADQNQRQHMPHIQFNGNIAIVNVASFRRPYLRYLAFIDGSSTKAALVNPGKDGLANGLLRITPYGGFKIVTTSTHAEDFLKVCVALDTTARDKAVEKNSTVL
ncbi:hypothetical protein O1611_g3320 [Lasiodiplodia mahajangana]|uniref:Uncharacterized protein n=1 Tax=Lasiodiplodia mahajangana TaxID=1108764 RepID=A0ACC2JS37_9PEZI|nr:hypothetical protein O1611_g3320 [Lasiodiplodia mahajangana]